MFQMMWSLAIYLCLWIGKTMQAPICKPTITEGEIGIPEIDGSISLECDISTCSTPQKVVYEKATINATWTPIFEAVNNTHFKALDTAEEYNLKHRNDYYAFRTSVHSLHIFPVILDDHGKWRCVFYDVTGEEYESEALDVNVYEEQLLENPEDLKLKEMSGSITARYETQEWLLMCSQSEGYDTIVLFDYGSTSVFIHDTSDLEKYKKYTCVVKIFEMIRISEDKYVVTEHEAHDIHLLKLKNNQFYTMDTMVQDKRFRRTLICGETDKSFIKCEFSGDDLQNKVIIGRVCLNNDKLESQKLTPEPFMVRGEPWRISLNSNKTELLIINIGGRIYRGDLTNYNPDNYDEFLAGHIDTSVRSLYIDNKDNLIVGTRRGNIHVYTHDKQHIVKHIGEIVRGQIVIDKRLFICSGIDKQEQFIKVFPYEDLFKDCSGGGAC